MKYINKNFTLIATISFSLFACNNEPKNTASQSHDSVHSTDKFEMPPMPEIAINSKVFIKNLKNGQQVRSPLFIEMGVSELSVDTANGVLKPASGHHHILIDMDSVATETVIPKDSLHIHFGNAQTSATLNLKPGTHKLTLQFADALHRSYGSKLTNSVILFVKEQ